MSTRRQWLGAAASAAVVPWAWAQAPYPARPLSWVVPYPAGGFGDAMSRLLVQKLGERMQQAVVVENKPGGAAQLAAQYVKQQPADGHTLLYADIGPLAMYPALYAKLSFSPLKDFAPLTRLFRSPLVVVVPAGSPFQTLADLLRAAAAGDGLNYGSYGQGSQPHVWTEQLRIKTRSRMTHVPYQGAAPALQDLMAGRLDFMCDVVASSLPLVREGKLRALVSVGSEQRLQVLPQVPTLTEAGHADLDIPGWNGVMVRAGTPASVVDVLHKVVVTALESPEVLGRYRPLGLEPAPLTPAAFGEFIQSESQRWGLAIRQAGVKVE